MYLKNIVTLIIVVGPSFYFGYIGKPAEMFLSILAGTICAAFLNIDKIDRVKSELIEIEMRKAVEEAYATLENLKELAKPLVISLITNLTYFGRLGGIDNNKKHQIIDELQVIAEKLSIKDKEFNETLSEFYRLHTWDHLRKIIDAVRNEKLPNNVVMKLNDICDYNSDKFPSVDKIKECFVDIELPHNIKVLIDEYDHYLKHVVKKNGD